MATRDRHDPYRADPEESAAVRIGAELRQARERLGWSLQALADHLRIRLPYMEAIEDGRIEELPGAAYAVGFVRTYAQALGLDADEISRRMRADAAEVNRRPELSFPAPVPDRGVPALAIVAVGAVLVVGAYVAWYRMSGNDRPGPDTVQTVPDRLQPLVAERTPAAPATPRPTTPLAATPLAGTPSAEAPSGIAPETGSDAGTEPSRPSISPGSAAAAPAPETPHIQVRAKADAWIQVRDVSGQVLLNRVLRNGETWSPPPGRTQTALLMTTGNAGGTEVLLDGVPSASLGNDGAVRRDLPLDADAIRQGRLTPPPSGPGFRVSPRNQ